MKLTSYVEIFVRVGWKTFSLSDYELDQNICFVRLERYNRRLVSKQKVLIDLKNIVTSIYKRIRSCHNNSFNSLYSIYNHIKNFQ